MFGFVRSFWLEMHPAEWRWLPVAWGWAKKRCREAHCTVGRIKIQARHEAHGRRLPRPPSSYQVSIPRSASRASRSARHRLGGSRDCGRRSAGLPKIAVAPISSCCFHFDPSGEFRLRGAPLLSPVDQQGMWRWDGLLRWVAGIADVLPFSFAITYTCVENVIKY